MTGQTKTVYSVREVRARRAAAKPPPKAVRAWACGRCGKVYTSKRDPNLATCCTCFRCGVLIERQYGSGDCPRCALENSLDFNERTLASVTQIINEHRAALRKMKVPK